ncbi:MAG TPA: hypothetical protein PLS49_06870 [Candidatus Woesebacteria bacterium]|nr:hypothetical protein [Candidatus Woesebacteria bacterium]
MISFFDTPLNSPILIILIITYGLVASITTFDLRLVQAKKKGLLLEDEPTLPSWIGVFYWIEWIIFIALILLNWKLALIVFAAKFVLKVLPVLEVIGNILMAPFKPKNKR